MRIGSSGLSYRRTVGIDDCLAFIESIAQLLKGGLALTTTLTLVADGLVAGPVRQALYQQASRIGQGETWSSALKTSRYIWSPALIQWVDIGQTTGNLYECLEHFVHETRLQRNFQRQWLQSLSYPCIVLFAAFSAAGVMHTMLGQQETVAAIDTHTLSVQSLPMSAQAPLGPIANTASGSLVAFVSDNILLTTGCAMVMVCALSYFARSRTMSAGQRQLVRHPLHQFGILPTRPMRIAQLFTNLTLLARCGIPLLSALHLSMQSGAVRDRSNRPLHDQLQRLMNHLRQGHGLTQAMEYLQWPPVARTLSAIAEQTGDLPTFFQQLAHIYTQQAHARQRRLVQLSGPIALLLAAAVMLGSYSYYVWPLYANLGQ